MKADPAGPAFCLSAFRLLPQRLQQFDFAYDGGAAGKLHVFVGHVDAQGAATYGDGPMVDAGFGAQRDGGGT